MRMGRLGLARPLWMLTVLTVLLAACEDAPAGPQPDETDAEAFDRLFGLAAQPDVPIAITYDTDFDDPWPTFQLALAHDPPRSAINIEGEDQQAGRVVRIGDGAEVVCWREVEDPWSCVHMDEPVLEFEGNRKLSVVTPLLLHMVGVPLDFLFFGLHELVAADPAWDNHTSTSITGRSARCATALHRSGYASSAEEDSTTVCLDEESGALLRYQTVAGTGGRTLVEAREVSEPDPAHFEIPAEPTDFLSGDPVE